MMKYEYGINNVESSSSIENLGYCVATSLGLLVMRRSLKLEPDAIIVV